MSGETKTKLKRTQQIAFVILLVGLAILMVKDLRSIISDYMNNNKDTDMNLKFNGTYFYLCQSKSGLYWRRASQPIFHLQFLLIQLIDHSGPEVNFRQLLISLCRPSLIVSQITQRFLFRKITCAIMLKVDKNFQQMGNH